MEPCITGCPPYPCHAHLHRNPKATPHTCMGIMHAWPPPTVAVHQHIPILSNLHTYPCSLPPSYPCKLSTFVYLSPHTHAKLSCSHTLSNMHGHPPWTLSLTTHPSPVHLSPSIPNSLVFFLTTFSLSTPHHMPLTTFSLSTPHHMPLTTFSLFTPHHMPITTSSLSNPPLSIPVFSPPFLVPCPWTLPTHSLHFCMAMLIPIPVPYPCTSSTPIYVINPL